MNFSRHVIKYRYPYRREQRRMMSTSTHVLYFVVFGTDRSFWYGYPQLSMQASTGTRTWSFQQKSTRTSSYLLKRLSLRPIQMKHFNCLIIIGTVRRMTMTTTRLDERQFKTAKLSQVPCDATVLKRFLQTMRN